MSSYKVKSGDSLSVIAQRELGHASLWPAIAKLNNISAPYTIYVGQTIMLPDTLPSSPSSSNAPAPAPGPHTPAAPASSRPGVLSRLMTWARANKGQAAFYTVSIGLTVAGLWIATHPKNKRRR